MERYFVMGWHDDWRGIDITMAHERTHSSFVWLMASVPMLVAVMNAVLVAAVAALLALQLGSKWGPGARRGGCRLRAGLGGAVVVRDTHDREGSRQLPADVPRSGGRLKSRAQRDAVPGRSARRIRGVCYQPEARRAARIIDMGPSV